MIRTTAGIDLGTTTITALAERGGEVLARRTVPTPKEAVEIGEAARRAVRGLGVEGIEAVGITGQQHGVLVVDASLSPLTPFVNWQDRRAEPALEEARSLAGDPLPRTGCRLSVGYGVVTLFWMRKKGTLPAGTACTLMDWFAASLTGGKPVTEASCAASLGCFDLVRGEWDAPILDALGLPRSLFPPLAKAGSVVGTLTREAAVDMGLTAGVPVHVGIGDNQASFLGSVRDPASTVLVNVGTGGQVSAWSPDCKLAEEVEARPFPGGGYLLVCAGRCGGAAFAALGRLFDPAPQPPPRSGERESMHRFPVREGVSHESACDASERFAVPAAPLRHSSDSPSPKRGGGWGAGSSLDALVALAEAVPPGCDGLVCEPFFLGTRQDPSRRGAFTGIGAANLTPGHFARAVLEGMARAFADGYDRLKGLRGPAFSLAGAGNALRANPLLARLVGEAFGLPLVLSPYPEEAAFGAALSTRLT
ncbi:MAG: hypothetical protein K2W96_10710 [Gemmataceae bacterium]|nr:hypothetical protein [Gemmataceae bacterium]